MKSTTATATIKELRRLFATYGLPEHLVCDNGPQFTSADFAEFMKVRDTPRELLSSNEPSTEPDITETEFADTSVTDDDFTDEVPDVPTEGSSETTTDPIATKDTSTPRSIDLSGLCLTDEIFSVLW